MAKLNQESKNFVINVAAKVNELNITAIAFREKVREIVSREGAKELGVYWQEGDRILQPDFAISTFFGTIIASVDHVTDGAHVLGRYQLWRYVGDPIDSKVEKFWSFCFQPSGSATWSIPGEFEWIMGNETDVVEFVYRVLAEFAGKLEEI